MVCRRPVEKRIWAQWKMCEPNRNENRPVKWLHGRNKNVVDVNDARPVTEIAQNSVLHEVLEIWPALVDAHGDSVPLERAELGGEGSERLALLTEVCLPVATCQV